MEDKDASSANFETTVEAVKSAIVSARTQVASRALSNA